jgi:hypothetical protein
MTIPPRDDPTFGVPFSTHVLGTVFGERAAVVGRLHVGDRLIIVPDPPGAQIPAVWVHASGGDVVGHLPNQVAVWLAPWLLQGGRCAAIIESIGGEGTESWRRLVVRLEPR